MSILSVIGLVMCVAGAMFYLGSQHGRKIGGRCANTSTNNARDEICPACRGIGHFSAPNTPDQDTDYCKRCCGQGKLSPVA